jgi:hypothetical protein
MRLATLMMALGIGLAACRSAPLVKPDIQASSRSYEAPAGMARIYVAYSRFGFRIRVTVGEETAILSRKTYTYFDVEPGETVIRVIKGGAEKLIAEPDSVHFALIERGPIAVEPVLYDAEIGEAQIADYSMAWNTSQPREAVR